jgi:hypothetical protein
MSYRRALMAVLFCAVLLFAAVPAVFAQSPDGDKLVVGQNYVLAAGDRIDGSLSVIGGDVKLETESVVDGDVAVVGGDLRIGGAVTGDIVVFGGSIVLEESAVVRGSVAGLGSSVSRSPGATVEGELFDTGSLPLPNRSRPPIAPPAPWQPGAPAASQAWSLLLWPVTALGWSLLMAMMAALAVLIAPRSVGRVANAVASQPLMSFVVGFVSLAIAALAGLVLLICCCLGLFVWLVGLIAILVGWAAVGLWVGQSLLYLFTVRNKASFLEAAVGAFLITFLSRLPFCLGGLIGLLIAALGLGAVVLTRFGTKSYPADAPHDDDADLAALENVSRDDNI